MPNIYDEGLPLKNNHDNIKVPPEEDTGQIQGDDPKDIAENMIFEQAEYNLLNRYPVFILLMHSGTWVSDVIQFATGSQGQFSHACISFDPSLKKIYSFGKITNKYKNFLQRALPLNTGFVQSKYNDPFFKQFKSRYALYVMYVDKDAFNAMQTVIERFVKNKKNYDYDIIGLFYNLFNIEREVPTKYFCSRFVATVIDAGYKLQKVPSLYRPMDLAFLKNISMVNRGDDLVKYDAQITLDNLECIKKKQYDKIYLAESVDNIRISSDEAEELQTLLDSTDPKHIWFTSDWHLFKNHYKREVNYVNTADIIKWCKQNITDEDVFIYLGDISFRYANLEDQEKSQQIMSSLPGIKILVLGNHDIMLGQEYFSKCGFKYVKEEITWKNYIFTHKPINMDTHGGMLNIHGHIHTNVTYNTTDGKHNINVYPKLYGNKPVTLDYIIHHIDELTRSHRYNPNNGLFGEMGTEISLHNASKSLRESPVYSSKNNKLRRAIQESVIIPKPTVFFSKVIDADTIAYMISLFKDAIGDRVAIKLHFGEDGNKNFLNPKLIKKTAEYANAALVDCNTAYEGSTRLDTHSHIETANKHGFSFNYIDILDSDGEIKLSVPGRFQVANELKAINEGDKKPYECIVHQGNHLSEITVGSHLANYDSMIVFTHFKGHGVAGFGGSIKNIGMGIASGKTGKLQIHDDWSSGPLFLERLVESASAISAMFQNRIIYVNILQNMSTACDCEADAPRATIPNIGVLVSNDIVAIEQASIDLIRNTPKNKDLMQVILDKGGYHQIEYADWLRMGRKDYYLRDISNDQLVKLESETDDDDDDDVVSEGWRADLPDSSFGIPEDRKFPLDSEKHVRSAIHLFGHAEDSKKKDLARRIKAAAKKYDIDIPETTQCYKYLSEGYFTTDEDLEYKVDEFKSGKNTIAFIIGVPGAGKSTLSRKLSAEDPNIKHAELDILFCHYACTEEKLKEKDKDGLIYDFLFKSSGKKYKCSSLKEINELYAKDKNILKHIFWDFVKYCKSKSNSKNKIILEGIWAIDLCEASELKDYTVLIKNTSAIVAYWRAMRRNMEEYENHSRITTVVFTLISLITPLFWGQLVEQHRLNKMIAQFKSFQKDKIDENAIDYKYLNEGGTMLRSLNVKNVVFDFGSVLVDVSGDLRKILNDNTNIPKEFIRPLIYNLVNKCFSSRESQIIVDPMNLSQAKAYFNKDLPDELIPYTDELFSYLGKTYSKYEYTDKLIDFVKSQGCNIYYLSNWPRFEYEVAKDFFEPLIAKFDGGLFSHECGFLKPDARIYHEFLRKTNIDSFEDCVFFDDNYENIEQAKSLGMKAFVFNEHTPIDIMSNETTEVDPNTYSDDNLICIINNANIVKKNISDINEWYVSTTKLSDSISRSLYHPTLSEAAKDCADKNITGEAISCTAYVYIPQDAFKPNKESDTPQAILIATITILPEGRYEWDIQYPIKIDSENNIEFINKEHMAISAFNPVTGFNKHYVVYTGKKLAYVQDPDAEKGMIVNENGILEVVNISPDDVTAVYEFVGDDKFIYQLNKFYRESVHVNNLYTILTNKPMLTEDQIDFDPAFKKMDFDLIEQKTISELATIRDQVMAIKYCMDITRPIIESTMFYNKPSFMNKYNTCSDISIREDFDGVYFYSNLTHKRSGSVSSIKLLTENMLKAIL